MASSLFKRIAYIYTGTNNYAADYHFYKDILGGKLVWEFKKLWSEGGGIRFMW